MKQTKREKKIEDYWQKEYFAVLHKYRRKLSFWQPLGIIALLGIIVLFVTAVWNTAPAFDYQKFTITENVCVNETPNGEIVNSCLVYQLRINKTCKENATCMLDICLSPEQKCETKEVENLSYGKYAEVLNWRNIASLTHCDDDKDFDVCANSTCVSMGGQFIDYQCFIPRKYTISKKDLTEDWLNANCQCVWDCQQVSECLVCHEYHCGKDLEYEN
jgi:hypothetical protein